MTKYFFKRILEAFPVFLIIITAVFFMVRFVPGGPFDGEREVSAETMASLNAYYGLDKPLYAQYFAYLENLAHGDLGPSYKYDGWGVSEIIVQKGLVSLSLGAGALVLALAFGLLLGVASAACARTKWGGVLELASITGICLPAFVLGPVLILVFAIKLEFFNAFGFENLPEDAVLPCITLALFYGAWIAKLFRSGILAELKKNYVRTAKAKGASGLRIYCVHILRNCAEPVVSYLGPAAAGLLTGSFVVETVFQIPGLGRLFVSSALDNDYTMIMGCVIVYAAFIIAFNLLSDLLLALVNPRIATQMKK